MKKLPLIVSAICVIITIVLLLLAFNEANYVKEEDIPSNPFSSSSNEPQELESSEEVSDNLSSEEVQSEEPEEPYVSPIDFESLKSENPDIYAWINIPNTNISYPVLNREGDNEFYLDHNYLGDYSVAGSLFTEDYNSRDFSDPVTIIYGHNMASGDFFGNLRLSYSNPELLNQNNMLEVYTEDGMKTYEIFAAVPYGDLHILHYYNFADEGMFNTFIESVYSVRSLQAVFNEEIKVEFGDEIVVLSTCLSDEYQRERFLVLAVEQIQ